MKNYSFMRKMAVLLAMASSFACFSISAATTDSLMIVASDDVGIKMSGDTYPTDGVISVWQTNGTGNGGAHGGSASNILAAVIRYELPSNVTSISDAQILLSFKTVNVKQGLDIYGYQGAEDWSQDTLSWANSGVDSTKYPAVHNTYSESDLETLCTENNIDYYLGRMSLDPKNTFTGKKLHPFDITSYINKSIADGKTAVSFVIYTPFVSKLTSTYNRVATIENADGYPAPTLRLGGVVAEVSYIDSTFVDNNIEYIITGEEPNEVSVLGFADLATDTTTVVIPSSLTYSVNSEVYSPVSIATEAFSVEVDSINAEITSVSLPSSVTEIELKAFNKCRNLETINLSDVVSIGNSAFSTCDKMISTGELTSLTTLGNYVFHKCNSLSSMVTPSLITIGNGNMYTIRDLTSYNVPASVTTIGSIFMGTSESIPFNVTKVQVSWTDTTAVTINPTNFFRNIDLTAGGVTLYVPEGTRDSLYMVHSLWGQIPDANIIEGDIPDPVTSIAPAQSVAVSLYPNPTENGVITIGGADQVMTVAIYSISGAKVFEQSVSSNEQISTGLNSGVYMLTVDNANVQKLIVK